MYSNRAVVWIVNVYILMFLFAGSAAKAQTWSPDNGNGTFSNPLFYDEFSDPDMIRVGQDFYLTGTTMHAMPGLAVLHSRDLVNWEFESYALDRLDLGPEYRLEGGANVYGQGIWAPCLRYHDGIFYIFSNVNNKTTQLFRSKSPRGPWTRTPMKRGFHDLSVLFDDDGKVYVVWGYADIHVAELNAELTDIVPGTERQLIGKAAGMGEGLHLYKIKGKYYLTSAWYTDVMRMPVARADRMDGPWEVNRDISVGEQFGMVLGYRLSSFRPPLDTKLPYAELPPDPSADGRMAMHQGGFVDTPTGEWWGFSMFEGNALGRMTALSPVTWADGWPYFGLTGNLGRTPRTWVKPDTGTTEIPHAPYIRSDDFSAPQLQHVWQWNHVPVDSKWSLTERPGFLRLHALPAKSLWDARNTLTQRAIGPQSTPTAVLDATGMKAGDVAGLALLIQPEAWIGVERVEHGLSLTQYDGQSGQEQHLALPSAKVWLRAECDFMTQLANFSYSTDGKTFQTIGAPFRMVTIGVTFQGVRYALFNFNRKGTESGFADFDSIEIAEPHPHGLTRLIPYGKQITLGLNGHEPSLWLATANGKLAALPTANAADGVPSAPAAFTVVNRGVGRIALCSGKDCVSVGAVGNVTLRNGAVGEAESFQWIETFTGELTLMSLRTHRYLRVDFTSGALLADSPGPRPDGRDGVRFDWKLVEAEGK